VLTVTCMIVTGSLHYALPILAALRTEIRIADVARRHRAGAAGHVGGDCRQRRRLQSALSVRGAQLHLRHPRKGEERLFAHYPRDAGLRVVHEVEVLTEGAAVVRSHRTGEEQPVSPCELLLEEDSDRVVLDEVVVTQVDEAQCTERLQSRRREPFAVHRTSLRLARVVLRTGRARELPLVERRV